MFGSRTFTKKRMIVKQTHPHFQLRLRLQELPEQLLG